MNKLRLNLLLIMVTLGLYSCVPVQSSPTPTIDPTLQAQIVEATIQAAREESARVAQRSADVRLWAFIFLTIMVLAVIILLVVLIANLVMRWQYHQAEVYHLRTAHHRDSILMQDGKVIDPQLLTQPITDVLNPPELPLAETMKIKQGQQLVQIAASTQGKKSEVVEQLTQGAERPWRVYLPEQVPSNVPQDVLPLLDAEWKETHD